jgi:large-conductance mechanosensitive channel
MVFRFVFKRIFVANGNFKADHVQQKNSNTDVWLWDGAGMAPNQAEYGQFLQAAIEQLMVGTVIWQMALLLPLLS